MYILYSILVILSLTALVITSVIMIVRRVQKKEGQWIPKLYHIILWCVFTLAACILFADYMNPFDRTIEVKLVAECKTSPDHTFVEPDNRNSRWHAAFTSSGLCPGSFWFNAEPDTYVQEQMSHEGFVWPYMDFENHTYFISYGCPIESITYNVWNVIDTPHFTLVKAGYAEFGEGHYPNSVFIYEIDKMCIDNNFNGSFG